MKSGASSTRSSSACTGKYWYLLRCFPQYSYPKTAGGDEEEKEEIKDMINVSGSDGKRKPGGWKTMPYIVGNETFERLATFGMMANFLVYLVNHLHMKRVTAVNLSNIWFGTTNFAPLFGAFLSDAYLGRFIILAYASIASFLGMLCLTLTASIPALQPPSCGSPHQEPCQGPSPALLGVLFLSLGLLTIGAGGIRPCSLPFGVDQFDPTTEQGRKGINSFFNWYYFTFTAAIMIAITLIVYIQDTVSWALGLGIPTLLMFFSIIVFFLGTRFYVYVPPEGSVFSGIIQVFVAAYKKRSIHLEDQPLILYDPSSKSSIVIKLPLTQQFRLLNRAAVILEGEVKPDGSPANPWRLSSVQKIEEVKCLIRIIPIWASGIICFVAMAQQGTFSVLQAMKMNRHIGPHFQIPPGSLGVISMLTMTIFIPIYDRILVPAVTRLTHREGGITVLQRMGVGNAISILSMVVAALVEEKRRRASVAEGGGVSLSVLWLAPQLGLMGLGEALSGIAQIEFYYKQFPEHMRSLAGSLFFCSLAGSSYLSSVLVTLVHQYTGGGGHNWLDDNIDAGKLDYFYFLLAALGTVNLFYYVVCAHFYRYKGSSGHHQPPQAVEDEEKEDRERDEVRSKV